MAKKLHNEFEVKARVRFEEGQSHYYIDDVSIHYGRQCEHGDLGRVGFPLLRNQEVHNIVKDFLEEGIKQAEIEEEVSAEDSILNSLGQAHPLEDPLVQ